MAVALLGFACAPTTGWRTVDGRSCDPEGPAIVCLTGPEGRHELRVGERAVLPGECIEGPAEGSGGRLNAAVFRDGEPLGEPGFRVKTGWRTDVAIDGEDLLVLRRRRCDRRVETL